MACLNVCRVVPIRRRVAGYLLGTKLFPYIEDAALLMLAAREEQGHAPFLREPCHHSSPHQCV